MVFALLALLAAPARAQVASSAAPAIDVVWPPDGGRVEFTTRTFTFGSVTPGATLYVNGQLVVAQPSGAFFAMVPVSTGRAAFDYAAAWQGVSVSTRRVLEIASRDGLPETAPDAVAVLEPLADVELYPGDVLGVRCKGPPGRTLVFRAFGLTASLPMPESSAVPGLYAGHYVVQAADRGEGLKVRCGYQRGLFRGKTAEAPGKVTIADPGQRGVAVTSGKLTVLKSDAQGYSLFLPAGVKLETAGRRGASTRVVLSESDEAWVDSARLQLLPPGTPPPRGRIGKYASVAVGSDSVRVLLDAEERLPFEVRQTLEPLAFQVRFFGAAQRLDRIHYPSDDPVVRELRWRQESSRVVAIDVETRLRWGWGYDAFYDDRGHFVLEIRRPPDLAGAGPVLAGRRVVVDAGHGPEKSAVGPLQTAERDVNLAIAEQLRARLEAEGASVAMIRVSSDGPPLADRGSLAAQSRGDLYVSVHNNAFPASADPFEVPRGYMVFYYHPQSRGLAEAVHAAYRARHPELGDESVRWGDLAVCRTTQMPSILTESAYVILPEQEALLRDPAYQARLAETLASGIRSYYESYRALQKAEPAEAKAARR
ncbi:MAG: N-acetylmuramoyl-L-alanine amidase [Elusimicrobia bacterium]|nr:N-acetylmuramoyl-L-alanine amidase [Elusimicrobiota bacterium]